MIEKLKKLIEEYCESLNELNELGKKISLNDLNIYDDELTENEKEELDLLFNEYEVSLSSVKLEIKQLKLLIKETMDEVEEIEEPKIKRNTNSKLKESK